MGGRWSWRSCEADGLESNRGVWGICCACLVDLSESRLGFMRLDRSLSSGEIWKNAMGWFLIPEDDCCLSILSIAHLARHHRPWQVVVYKALLLLII